MVMKSMKTKPSYANGEEKVHLCNRKTFLKILFFVSKKYKATTTIFATLLCNFYFQVVDNLKNSRKT